MNIFQFIDRFSSRELDQDLKSNTVQTRRDMFRQFGNMARDAAAIGLPIGAALLSPNRAMAQTTGDNTVLDVLNFALTLEYLEAEFYVMGLDAGGLLSGRERSVVEQISRHENAHVEFLKTAISGSGGTPVDKPTFDFTAGGAFADVFTNPDTFMALAQAFEDTGVRAYKGQAANLMTNATVLQAALQIHSVEARHASEIRRLRGSKGWITNAMNTTAPAADAVYAGEDNFTHLGVDARNVVSVDIAGLTEAYDEPLSMSEVNTIAGLFIS
jgi:rubrerythrin